MNLPPSVHTVVQTVQFLTPASYPMYSCTYSPNGISGDAGALLHL